MLDNNKVKTLKQQALTAGDLLLADLCTVVLSNQDSDGFGLTLGKPITLAEAKIALREWL